MSTALIIQDMSADFSAAALAAGVTLVSMYDKDAFPKSGLIDYYDFSEGAGAVVGGRVNGLDATIVGTGSSWVAGLGLSLPATSGNYVQFPFLQTVDFEYLLLTKVLSTDGTNHGLLGPWNNTNSGSSANAGLSFVVNPSNNLIQLNTSGASATTVVSGTNTPSMNVWRIFSISRSSTGNAAIQTDVTNQITKTIASGDFVPATTGLSIGVGVSTYTVNNNQSAQQVKGLMAWNRQLTAAERFQAMSSFLVSEASAAGITLGSS